MTTPFETGQKVIYTSEAREQIGLSREVEAVVEGVHYSIINTKDSPPIYTISWPPTGRATVNGREIRAVPEQTGPELGLTTGRSCDGTGGAGAVTGLDK